MLSNNKLTVCEFRNNSADCGAFVEMNNSYYYVVNVN